MRGLNKTQRNYVIIGLCMVLVIMAVGYAAFSTNLQIKGSTDITSNWDLHIKDGGVNPENVVEATSTKSIKVDALTAEFACELITPGKSKIDYVIEVENSGTLNAKLDRINVTGATNAISVTTTPTNESLTSKHLVVGANGGTAKIKVTVSYNDVTTQPSAEDLKANIKVTLDFSQTDEEATPASDEIAFTGTIYRFSSETISIGNSIKSVSGTKYCATFTGGNNETINSCDFGYFWDTQSECESFLTTNNVSGTCAAQTGTFGGISQYIKEDDYPTATARTTTLNSPVYLKHTVVDDIITESFTCTKFSFMNEEVCVQGGDASYYSANKSILEGLSNTFSLNGGACSSDSSWSHCDVGDLYVAAKSDIVSSAIRLKKSCVVMFDGSAYCEDETQNQDQDPGHAECISC